MMQAVGFVLHFTSCDGGRDGPVDVRHAAGFGTAAARGFRLFVRPLVSTPEAARERQPIVSPSTFLVYAGRLDNRNEIADSLGRPQLAGATDGELLRHAYEMWGSHFPAKVIGEYSFAVVDRRAGHLVAGRDSLGLGRLYIYEDSHGVWLASSLDLLLPALSERPPLDRDCLIDYFAGGGILAPGRTVYKGIRELPAAHVVTWKHRRSHVQRYWQPDPDRRLSLRAPEEYDEAFRGLLLQATHASLRSNTPVWSDLSGGLDSSTVTAVAASLQQPADEAPRELSAFSLVASATAASDERAFQFEFLSQYPLEHFMVDADAHLGMDSFEEPPSAHPSKEILYRPMWQASRELFRTHGVVAHLTGKGGDPLFCVPVRFTPEPAVAPLGERELEMGAPRAPKSRQPFLGVQCREADRPACGCAAANAPALADAERAQRGSVTRVQALALRAATVHERRSRITVSVDHVLRCDSAFHPDRGRALSSSP
jgi:asparagine synthetase B (glutamine-hydrolysing)